MHVVFLNVSQCRCKASLSCHPDQICREPRSIRSNLLFVTVDGFRSSHLNHMCMNNSIKGGKYNQEKQFTVGKSADSYCQYVAVRSTHTHPTWVTAHPHSLASVPGQQEGWVGDSSTIPIYSVSRGTQGGLSEHQPKTFSETLVYMLLTAMCPSGLPGCCDPVLVLCDLRQQGRISVASGEKACPPPAGLR